MDMKRNKLIGLLSLCLLAATFASCEDWNETEAVKQKVERPEDQNPELWAEYTAALRDYKQSEHFIVYARLFNSPQPGTSEKDFMRCLPDSLDIVSLTNADNFSKYDAEDMPAMREKGTKVLYQVDYAGRSGELTDQNSALTSIKLSPRSRRMDWTVTRLRVSPMRATQRPQRRLHLSSNDFPRQRPKDNCSFSKVIRFS